LTETICEISDRSEKADGINGVQGYWYMESFSLSSEDHRIFRTKMIGKWKSEGQPVKWPWKRSVRVLLFWLWRMLVQRRHGKLAGWKEMQH